MSGVAPNLPETYLCEWCGAETEAEEFVINFGVCDACFNASLDEYFESHAGPYDWIKEPDAREAA